MWTILAWIVGGGVAGWLASMIVEGHGLGLLGDIIVGIVGAFIGGLLLSLIGGPTFTGFNLWSLIVAFIGTVVLLLVIRLFTYRRYTSPL